jgi:hypothetical protein
MCCERTTSPSEAERDDVLQVRADGEDRREPRGHRDGERGEAARAAQELQLVALEPPDAVVGVPLDGAVVDEEEVREAAEALEGLALVDGDRLVREVAARGDERGFGRLEEEVVERRRGQHQPEARRLGGHVRGDEDCGRSRIEPRKEEDRRLRRKEPPLRRAGDLAEGAGGGEVLHHEGQRLLPPHLPLAQACDGLGASRVAAEVEAAQSLHRDDPALEQRPRRAEERGVALGHRRAGSVPQRETRAAGGAGGRLRVKATVARVLVLAPALLAELESAHRRVWPVVGEGADDREARAAARAVEERVAVPPVGRVAQLAQAVVARGEVGENRDALRARSRALPDLERDEPRRLEPLGRDAPHDRPRRRLGLQAPSKLEEGLPGSLHLYLDAPHVVQDPARQPHPGREAVDEGPEADPLDGPPHLDAKPPDLAQSLPPPGLTPRSACRRRAASGACGRGARGAG